MKLNRRTLL